MARPPIDTNSSPSRDPRRAAADPASSGAVKPGNAAPANTGLTCRTVEELEAWMVEQGERPFRARQVYEAVQKQGRVDAQSITTLPQAMRDKLSAAFGDPATKPLEVQRSEDGTRKYLFGLHDGRKIESVLIPEGGRRTVCISSQVGCPIKCIFCASGVAGLVRNLSASEIIEQLLRVREETGERPTHVVMMGMGEPLLNYDAVVAALHHWISPDSLDLSPRRITVSTAATPARIDALARSGLGVNLAISLHGSDDESRSALVPGSPRGRVQGLVDAAARYANRTRRDATVEYVLIRGLNDGLHHADHLATAIRGQHIHVNLIPLNPVRHRPELQPPSGREAHAFLNRLRDAAVSATLRTQRGEDIDAACGQLALDRAVE